MMKPIVSLKRAARITLDNVLRSRDRFDPQDLARMYEEKPDPWNLETEGYEGEKHRTALAGLDRDRYRSAVEIGCSIGVLTSMLAERTDRLLAIDLSDIALRRARIRNATHSHVLFERRTIPEELPSGEFDLIVLSEVLYYLSDADAEVVADWAAQSLQADGEVLLVNWLGHLAANFPRKGDAAASHFVKRLDGVTTRTSHGRGPGFRFDVLKRH